MLQAIVFFDDKCNLCSTMVQFIIKNDPKKRLKFASLHTIFVQQQAASEFAKANSEVFLAVAQLLSTQKKVLSMDTVVFYDGKTIHTKSAAALKIAKNLSHGWSFFYVFILVPPFIRDFVYELVAKNRYKWFGQKTECWLPNDDIKSRFLG